MSETNYQRELESSSGQSKRLSNTNMYYAQYASGNESEPGYDSDSVPAARTNHFKRFRRLCENEEFEKESHRNWIEKLNQHPELNEEVEEYTGMSVRLKDESVRFKRHMEIEGRRLKYFRVRIVIVYKDCIRKWAFDKVRSHVPDAVGFPDDVVFFHEPLSKRILDIVVDMCSEALDYIRKAYYFEFFMFKVENDYLDVTISLKQDFTEMLIKITDNAWPEELWRTCWTDTLTLNFGFDEDCSVVKTSFKFKYKTDQDLDRDEQRRNIEIVTQKLADVESVSLTETFEKLMGKALIGNRYRFNDLKCYLAFLDP